MLLIRRAKSSGFYTQQMGHPIASNVLVLEIVAVSQQKGLILENRRQQVSENDFVFALLFEKTINYEQCWKS